MNPERTGNGRFFSAWARTLCLPLLIFALGALPTLVAAQTQSDAGVGQGDDGQGQVVELLITWGVRVIGVLVVLIVGLIIAGWLRRLTMKACERSRLDLTLAKFFGGMVRWLVLIIVGIFCLGTFGVPTTGLATIIAAMGLAVGLALQGTLSNFSAGVMLLIFRPYRVGDVITVAGITAKVDEIQLFTTTLDTPDNRRIIVPNGAIFGSTIENISHHATRRVDVAVGTDYGADLDRTRRVLQEAADSVDGRLRDQDTAIVLANLGASSIDWSVRVWVASADYWAVKDRLTRDVKVALNRAEIAIPFPQMDVHLDQPAA